MHKLFIIVCYSIALNAYGLSFDCAKAKSKFELYICQTNELIKLDDRLNVAYKEALSVSEKPKEITSEQLLWLRERDECLSSPIISVENCLLMTYNKRIIRLSSITKSLNEISGNYFNMSIYCPSPTKEHGFPCDSSWGSISINDGNLKMETVGANYHSCSFSAKIIKQGPVFKAEKASDVSGKICTINLYSDGEQLITDIDESSQSACSDFCGARTRLHQLYASKKILAK